MARSKIEFWGETDMRKWIFWSAMCVVSLLNGGAFFGASCSAMRRGIDGVENQSSLMFIPLLWVIAAFVLLLINLYTFIGGARIKREQMIRLADVLCLSGLSGRAKTGRIAFFTMTVLLMLFGYSLFAAEAIWALAYGLSGGTLLLFLYAWRTAARRADR